MSPQNSYGWTAPTTTSNRMGTQQQPVQTDFEKFQSQNWQKNMERRLPNMQPSAELAQMQKQYGTENASWVSPGISGAPQDRMGRQPQQSLQSQWDAPQGQSQQLRTGAYPGSTGPYSGAQNYPNGGTGGYQYNQQSNTRPNLVMDELMRDNIMQLGDHTDPKVQEQIQSYMNYASTLSNMNLAQQQQGYNEYSGQQNFGEQQRVNTSQMELAQQAQELERQGFGFAQNKFAQELAAQQQQFGVTSGQSQQSLDNQYALGNRQVDATNQNNRWNYDVGMGQNTNTADRNRNDFTLGQGQLAGQNQNNVWDYEVNRQNADTGRLTANNQSALGQGQLSHQGRELDVNDAYRRQALAQEADLTQKRLANEMTQSRYSTFGRAQAPNARMNRSWS